ncbi:MAG: hypothetical protein HYW33_01340 [Candidatus Blackburnbacteria bacterium]|nr:hypothetical protein [Candidatus Blackburnbacteria bacterium]
MLLAHLSDVAPTIPFSPPRLVGEGEWEPVNHNLLPQELQNNPAVVWVKAGDIVGKAGFSGLRRGYQEYVPEADRPIALNLDRFRSWDIPHVHVEEFSRMPDRRKIGRREVHNSCKTTTNRRRALVSPRPKRTS